MPSAIFQALSKQKVDTFRTTFATLAKEVFYDADAQRLMHSAEFGTYRERLCADFLKLYLPTYLSIGSGFLINRENEVSTQCDLVIFDPQYTPLVEDAHSRRFFPAETVAAIGEVKSTLSKQGLLDALVKLATAKRVRKVEGKSPVRRSPGIVHEDLGHHYDEVVSFLICEKLSFKIDHITAEVSKHYDKHGIDPKHRHNLVLSLEDGIFCYKNHLLRRNVAWMWPWTRGERMKNRFVMPGENGHNHFGIFTSSLFTLCTNATIYLPELGDYDVAPALGEYQDER